MAATAAPSYQEIFKFEDYIESAFEAVFESYDSIDARTQRSTANLTTPRVELQFQLGAALGEPSHLSTVHTYGDDNDAVPFWETYEGTLIVRIVTDRDNEATAGSHLSLIQRARFVMATWPKKIDTLNAPYHAIHEVRPNGTNPVVTGEQSLDVSEMTYGLVFGVRSTAWPQV